MMTSLTSKILRPNTFTLKINNQRKTKILSNWTAMNHS